MKNKIAVVCMIMVVIGILCFVVVTGAASFYNALRALLTMGFSSGVSFLIVAGCLLASAILLVICIGSIKKFAKRRFGNEA